MPTANIDEALALVAKHFRGMTDRDGEPYVMHCLRVMMGVQEQDARLVGLMHDLVEDTPVTLEQLTEMGFSAAVVEAIGLVTHSAGVSYADYVIALKGNPLARAVKLSDLRDNASMARVLYRPSRRETDLLRLQRYVLSYQFLEDRIGEADYRSQMAELEE